MAYFTPVQNTWNNLSPALKAVLLMFVLLGTSRGVVQIVATELPERRTPELADVDAILHRCAKSAVLGIAHAAGNSLPADRRESVRSAHRIVGKNSVQSQRVLPENGQ